MGQEILRSVSPQKFNVAFTSLTIRKPTIHQYDVGLSINDVIDDLGIRPVQEQVHVFVDGRRVDFSYEPNADDYVQLAVIQEGTGLEIIGWIVVAAVVGAAVGYFLYKPPKEMENDQQGGDSRNSLSSANNRPTPYQPFPLVLGKVKVTPVYMQSTFVETEFIRRDNFDYVRVTDSNDYLYMLLTPGLAPMRIENLKIGGIPIEDYPDIQYQIYDGITGYDSIPTVWKEYTLRNEEVNIPVGGRKQERVEVTRDISDGVNHVVFNFNFPQGLIQFDQKGNKKALQSRIVGRLYAPGNPNPVATLFNTLHRNTTEDEFGWSVAVAIPPSLRNIKGLRVTVTATPKIDTSNSIMSTCEWTSYTEYFRMPNDNHIKLGNVDSHKFTDENGTQYSRELRPALIALKVKASDQLTGVIDDLTCECTSMVPSDWSEDWRKLGHNGDYRNLPTVVTENPADIYRWLLQGNNNMSPLANNRLDINGLLDWRQKCISDGWKIGYFSQEDTTLLQVLKNVAMTGRASFSFADGKYGAVIEEPRYIPEQLFTPRNSWGFKGTAVFLERMDGVRYKFSDKDDDYEETEEYFYDPVLPPTQRRGVFEATEIWGVTDSTLARRHVAYKYWEKKLRRKSYEISTDIEGFVPRRGSLVRIAYPTIEKGMGWGRIQKFEYGGSEIIIDENIGLDQFPTPIFWDNNVMFWDNQEILWDYGLTGTAGASCTTWGNRNKKIIDPELTWGSRCGQLSIQVRFDDGRVSNSIKAAVVDTHRLRLERDIPEANEGDLVVYGINSELTLDCIVVEVKYNQDLSCTLTLVNAANELYTLAEQI